MARVAIVGCGVAGLSSALALADQGHAVTILERDATPLPPDPATAFTSWTRTGAPQVRHSHAFLARLRLLLADRAPAVLDDLYEAGATDIAFTEHPPPTLVDRDPRPGDDSLVALACRRTTFEWVMRRRVLARGDVTVRDGCRVTGLLTDDGGVRPRVVGVQARHGDDELSLRADLVVDASGSRSPSPAWLAAIGAGRPGEESEACEIVYLSRFHRLIPGAAVPESTGPIAADLGYLKFAVFPGDNGTFSITLAVDSADGELRRLARADRFDAAVRAVPLVAPWIDPAVSEPLTEVHVMAGLRNRRRSFVSDGQPIAPGFAAVGDASVCTNPLYGRGCSLAAVHAFALADLAREHDVAGDRFALALQEATDRELLPWYRMSVLQDRQSREAAAGEDVTDDSETDPAAFMRSITRDGLLPAVRLDPVVFRAFLRWFNLLTTPDALVSDPDLANRVLAVWQERDERPPEPLPGPPRDELLAQVAAA